MAERHPSRGTFSYVRWLENRLDRLEQRLQALNIGYEESFRDEVPEVLWAWLCNNRSVSALTALVILTHRYSDEPMTTSQLSTYKGTIKRPSLKRLLDEDLCRVNSKGQIFLCHQLQPLVLLPYLEMMEDLKSSSYKGKREPLPFTPTYNNDLYWP